MKSFKKERTPTLVLIIVTIFSVGFIIFTSLYTDSDGSTGVCRFSRHHNICRAPTPIIAQTLPSLIPPNLVIRLLHKPSTPLVMAPQQTLTQGTLHPHPHPRSPILCRSFRRLRFLPSMNSYRRLVLT